jgi:fructokinase
MIRIGIDLGGTKTEIIALDAAGTELLRQRRPTPGGDYAATLRQIVTMVTETEAALGETGSVGIGVPGSISPATGLMRNANSTCLNGQPLKRDLEAALQRSIAVSNDANCFALSEATDGAGAGATSVFSVIIGTGTGAGLVVDGVVIGGHNGIAGEWGHNPLPWPQPDEYPGPACWCGHNGCIETWLSGPGFARDHAQAGGQSLAAEAIVAAAEAGDPGAQRALQRYQSRLARGLAHIINVFDPEVIVLGGGMSNIQSLYLSVPEDWGQYVFSDCVRTCLLPPRHGDSSGVRGAAWLGAAGIEA